MNAEPKICAYCKHMKMPQNELKIIAHSAQCTAPFAYDAQELANKTYFLVDGQIRAETCFAMRLAENKCGPHGVWFERRAATGELK